MALLAGGFQRVGSAEASRLGTVNFVATGAEEAQPHFQRGIAALHSFWYEEAQAAFRRALEIDPRFAMAWWGIAMTYHRPYLAGSDDAAGRAALERVGDLRRLTRREAAFIEALKVYFSDQSWASRTLAYAAAMEKLHRDYPGDIEATAFYALSLLGYGWATDEGFARQERAAAMASEVLGRNPRHPGAAHYLIHSFDEPSLAVRGLDAARHYATIAPDAPHALHMPSHIFLQLGLWRDVAASNEAGWDASDRWVKQQELSLSHRDYHNYHWLIYACLQQGRLARAAELLSAFQGMRGDIDPDSRHFLDAALASFVVETRSWAMAEKIFTTGAAAENIFPRTTASVELCGSNRERGEDVTNLPAFIRALAAAAEKAPEAKQRLVDLRRAVMVNKTTPRFWQIRILEVDAMERVRAGDFEAAIVAAREATALEISSGPPPGPPSSIKPPHELAGEILLQAGRPAEALAQFDVALQRHPNRALALLGRARALAAMKDASARAAYAALIEVWSEADGDLPELREARDFVARKLASNGE